MAKPAKAKVVPFTGEHMLRSEYLSPAQKKVFGKATRAESKPAAKKSSTKKATKRTVAKATAESGYTLGAEKDEKP